MPRRLGLRMARPRKARCGAGETGRVCGNASRRHGRGLAWRRGRAPLGMGTTGSLARPGTVAGAHLLALYGGLDRETATQARTNRGAVRQLGI